MTNRTNYSTFRHTPLYFTSNPSEILSLNPNIISAQSCCLQYKSKTKIQARTN